MEERALVIGCEGERLVGVLHDAAPEGDTGIVIVVGGPQYRVGSHRQFVLMARRFAAAGFPTLRFDVRGMGDSEGSPRCFEALDADIRAAIDKLSEELPRVKRMVLIGLCDAASAILMYGYKDSRVAGLIVLNPWVRTMQGEARTYLRHYYVQRVLQKSFWQKVFSGTFSPGRSVREFLRTLLESQRSQTDNPAGQGITAANFVERMNYSWKQFPRPVLVIISGRDLVAKEFLDLCQDDVAWRELVERTSCSVRQFPKADHTLSDRRSLDSVADSCSEWLRLLPDERT